MPDDGRPQRHPTIAALYAAFARCTIPQQLSYCTYCDTEEYERSLHAPLDALPCELVDKYLADAIHHTGDAQDFRYFLPRIIELECERDLSWWWVLPDRLKQASFATWSDVQRSAALRAIEHAATVRVRDDRWFVETSPIEGIDWPWVFAHWPALDDATSDERLAMRDRLDWGGFLSEDCAARAAFEEFRVSDEGQRMLARLNS